MQENNQVYPCLSEPGYNPHRSLHHLPAALSSNAISVQRTLSHPVQLQSHPSDTALSAVSGHRGTSPLCRALLCYFKALTLLPSTSQCTEIISQSHLAVKPPQIFLAQQHFI